MYFVKTPFWLKKIYNPYVWHIRTKEKAIYLTFDDGPHPIATPFALDALQKNNAKATFFCIGKNVTAHPEIYERILQEGHSVGNHTYHHLNGWKTDNETYLNDIGLAKKHIGSNLFRPPYGRIRKQQGKQLKKSGYEVIMWDVLSGDFDTTLPPGKCLENVVNNTKQGSIIVFHDSTKAFENMSFALPRVLSFFGDRGYSFKTLNESI